MSVQLSAKKWFQAASKKLLAGFNLGSLFEGGVPIA
jgi:hypothetical protein